MFGLEWSSEDMGMLLVLFVALIVYIGVHSRLLVLVL